MKLSHLAAVAAFATSLIAQTPEGGPTLGSLSTPYGPNNSGNAGGAIYFNLTATSELSVFGFDLALNASQTRLRSTPASMDIYVIRGSSFQGNETDSSLWTLEGSIASEEVLEFSAPTAFVLEAPLVLNAGELTAIALVCDQDVAHAYTNGSIVGGVELFSNADLELQAGTASNVPFTGPVFDPRNVNCNVNYALGSGYTIARTASFGTGCGEVPFWETIYEQTTGPIDLSNSNGITFTWTGSSYEFNQGASAIVAPSGAGTQTFADDETQQIATGLVIPTPAGDISDVYVCSNGFVAYEPTTDDDFSPSAADLLARVGRWCPLWSDLSPNEGGTIDAELMGTTFHVTWTDVPQYSTSNLNTFQVSIHQNGDVEFKYGQCDQSGPILVGTSPGGNVVDPGSVDLSAASTTLLRPGRANLSLGVSGRPVIGQTIEFSLDNNPDQTSSSGAVILGIPQATPIPLDIFGVPGCVLYVDEVFVIPVSGSTAAATGTVAIPGLSSLLGSTLQAQGVGLNPVYGFIGFATSNGIELRLGDV